ncbi:MAG: lysophospholipid transporter LplT [Betaproteobacteria bacterium]
MPHGFKLLIAAQFLSALADNALLVLTIAWVEALAFSPWWVPLLKWVFIASYVVLAPWVGPLADLVPKPRLMAWMNQVKLLGALMMLFGVNPVAAYACVGLGAAAYAPAKYGLVTELVPPSLLVRANAWIEVSVVCAALLGVVLGGLLVSPWLLNAPQMVMAQTWLPPQAAPVTALAPSLLILMGLYLLAGALNLGIPRSGQQYARRSVHPLAVTRDFWQDNLKLWRDDLGGLSLAVTTLFWGVGACLQFLVLHWAQQALHLSLSQAAYLQAAIAVGVIVGAASASRWVSLERASSTVGMGVGLGLMMPLVALCDSLWTAVPALMLAGAFGGWMVVPLNALLQHRGASLLTPGRSIAVQGFNENISVLLILALYALLVRWDVPVQTLMWSFGLTIAGLMLLIRRWYRRSRPPTAPAH